FNSSTRAPIIPFTCNSRSAVPFLPVSLSKPPSSGQRLFSIKRMASERPWFDDAEIFRHRRAAPIRMWERWLLGVLLFLGVQSIFYFGSWWFREEHVNN